MLTYAAAGCGHPAYNKQLADAGYSFIEPLYHSFRSRIMMLRDDDETLTRFRYLLAISASTPP
jgi:hypothetical protein